MTPAPPPAPVRYIIAATPRTGTTLLALGLSATGVAGRPDEFFAPHLEAHWRRAWSLGEAAEFAAYLDRARSWGTTANGVHGLKIHWEHVVDLASRLAVAGSPGWVLDTLLPSARYINTVRRDRRAQALSLFRATITDRWFRSVDEPPDSDAARAIPFDPAEISAIEARLEREQDAWSDYFEALGVEPLVVVYEDLAADHRREVARVLTYLGLDPATAAGIPAPPIVAQADDVTDSWRRLMDAAVASVGRR